VGIALKDIKLLWGRAGNRCAICREELSIDAVALGDDDSVIGDMAHIVARKPTFTRGDYAALTDEQRDKYENLILLCKNDHKRIDDQSLKYTVERLRQTKADHERWVRNQLSPDDLRRQRDDETYAMYVQELIDHLEVDEWTRRGTWICSSAGPEIEMEYHDRLVKVSGWLLSLLWPQRYGNLEDAFANFSNVLNDFLTTFGRHAERGWNREWLVTSQFYRSREWLDPTEYDAGVQRYEEHTALVEDLFLELTRALNYISDAVRQTLLPSFRLHKGAVLVERGPVGFDMHIERLRPEYRSGERTARPYPGLDAFRTVRRTRDFCIRADDADLN
jgi:hypothetical protein